MKSQYWLTMIMAGVFLSAGATFACRPLIEDASPSVEMAPSRGPKQPALPGQGPNFPGKVRQRYRRAWNRSMAKYVCSGVRVSPVYFRDETEYCGSNDGQFGVTIVDPLIAFWNVGRFGVNLAVFPVALIVDPPFERVRDRGLGNDPREPGFLAWRRHRREEACDFVRTPELDVPPAGKKEFAPR